MKTEIRIFVSYRREDSRHQTDRLCDHLVAHFGAAQVFQDVDKIPLRLDFRRVLTEQVARCDVFLAVLGDAWLSIPGPSGTRRIDDPADFVRIEIETALGRNIPIIAVLVGNASVPPVAELPESLRELTYRHGLRVRPNPDFRHDVDRLIRGVEDVVSAPQTGAALGAHWRHGPADVKFALADPSTDARPVPPGLPAGQRVEPAVPAEPPKPITSALEIKLALIPAGEFLMGSPNSDNYARADERPQHRVRITQPFSLGIYVVTQGQYRDVTGENPSSFKGSDDLTVESISWHEAIAFCNKLSEREGLKPYYQFSARAQSGGEGYRLPTEAEWEYAARAGSTTQYSFGDDAASLGEYGWFAGNSEDKIHPVGQKRPNAFGLFDMHGNVWEWCWDGFDPAYYASSPDADPDGPSRASVRVFRGGSWYDSPRFARSADRSRYSPGNRHFSLGFRLARVKSGR